MTVDTENLARQLTELADMPAPPMAVDITKARESGRRTLRRRRTAMICTAAGLAVAIGVAAATLPRHTPAVPVAPIAGRDPLTVPATFGWLPEWITSVGYQTGGLGGTLVHGRGTGTLGPDLQLHLYPAGPPPALGSFALGEQQYAVPAAPVNGGTAYWITRDAKDLTNAREPFLRWQVPDGRWAEITAAYVDSSVDLLTDLPHMAGTVVIRDHKVPLPLRITRLPDGFTIQNTDLYRPSPVPGTGPWSVEMLFTFSAAPNLHTP
jgi:hypothetical protein